MYERELYDRLLGLSASWFVADVKLDTASQQVDAFVEHAHEHGTPLFVVDHAELRKNYRLFKKHFPRVQAYYAVKVNSDPAIVETFYKLGGSFDVASMQEFRTVYKFIKVSATTTILDEARSLTGWHCSTWFRRRGHGTATGFGEAAGVGEAITAVRFAQVAGAAV